MNTTDKQMILVVDDSKIELDLLQELLSSHGYSVETALDGLAALSKVATSPPSLILLDVMMPGMDGYEVCRQLKKAEATKKIPIIFVTGTGSVADEARCFEVGGDDYIAKPIHLPVLLARVRTQLALHNQRRTLEGMFRDVIEFAPDAFIIADFEGVIVQANVRAQQVFGYNRRELIGSSIELLVPSRLRSRNENHLSKYLRPTSMTVVGLGLPCLRKDGTEFPGDINISPLHTDGGPLLMAVARDVSQRVDQEAQLRESEASLAKAQGRAHLGSWTLDLATLTTTWSAENFRLHYLDSSRGAPKFHEFLKTVHRDDRAAIQEVLTRAEETSDSFAAEYRTLSALGPERILNSNIHVIRDESGQLLRLEGTTLDVTARRTQEAQLKEAARYSRSLFNASLDPLVRIDKIGKISDVNLAGELMTGVPREQLIGSSAECMFDDPENMYDGFRKIVADGQVTNWPMTIRHASGRLIAVECNANPYRNEEGKIVGVFASARDVTETRRIQSEVAASRQQLRELATQSEYIREEEKKQIARDVHDELGQVLTALRMDLSFLGMQLGGQNPSWLAKTQSMKGLVDRAIQGVRNVAGSLRPAALDMGLLAAIEWQGGEFSKTTGIPFSFHAEQDPIELDELRSVVVFRIVQESLTNVTRYANATSVTVTFERRGRDLCLEIRDNGQGFRVEEKTKKKTFGLLGMRERAIGLGGTLEVTSAPGRGTQIELVIPLDNPNAKDAP